ncbi:MAG: hypothetical protein IJ564_06910 [Alphaproteobacteria bacterium]|nr:hypothetical protein [Alphaproteobacteria bacterium]MBR3661894.1 hypothetical protein [Alphaproteobacteria bacterium]
MANFRTNLAAIDLGTNSCRIRITDNKGNIIYRNAETVKLGEGMDADMRFTEEAISRGLNYFDECAKNMNKYNVGQYRAITTASCRMAKNGAEFVEMVKQRTGIELDIVSAYEEAVLNLRGALLNVKDNSKYIVVYDLGGGSTEITLAKITNPPKIIHTISVPWGARNASEHFGLVEYNELNAEKLRNEIKTYVQKFITDADYFKYAEDSVCISTSSTPLRLVSMINNEKEYEQTKADGISAPVEKFDEQIAKIKKMTFKEMSEHPCISEKRASIFVAAGIIFKTIYDELKIKNITASLKGAQDAIIEDLMRNGGKTWQN